jgi:hypothetical protein
MRFRRYLLGSGIGLAVLLIAPSGRAFAQSLAVPIPITFNSFNAVYHLSRDAQGRSLLTTEEVILADFPASGYYGISRSIPQNYQNHSVAVKILSTTDAAGRQIPYKTASDGKNLNLTVGDPDIKLYGSQTFRINYQTRDVVNINQPSDQFLLDQTARWGQITAWWQK